MVLTGSPGVIFVLEFTFHIYFISVRQTVWSTGSSFDQIFRFEFRSNWNWFIVSLVSYATDVHAYFYILLLYLSHFSQSWLWY